MSTGDYGASSVLLLFHPVQRRYGNCGKIIKKKMRAEYKLKAFHGRFLKRSFSGLGGKQLRQTNAAAPQRAFKALCGYWRPCTPFGCFAALRSLSHCLFRLKPWFGQLLCPSCSFVPFVLRSALLHRIRSPPLSYKAR
jgi:hypothetical protein